jgi:hypothetical protein
VKGESTQPVKVRPKEVSVGLGSYPGDGEGDQSIEAPGTETRLGRVRKRAGRNASEARASLERPKCERRVPSRRTKANEDDQMHRQGTVALLAGVVGAARTHAVIRNTGDLSGCRGDLATPPSGDGRGRRRRGSYDRRTRVMPGEERSPGSGCA